LTDYCLVHALFISFAVAIAAKISDANFNAIFSLSGFAICDSPLTPKTVLINKENADWIRYKT